MSTRFDWVLSGASRGPDPTCDVDLLNREVAAVVPTLGSVVPNWLLVIPRVPAFSVADLRPPDRAALLEFATEVGEQLRAPGEGLFFFEHGPALSNSDVGCGVDQAHIHVLACDLELSSCLQDPTVEWTSVSASDPWSERGGAREYYLFGSEEGYRLGIPSQPYSQYFRRIIADKIGRPDEWDYRVWPHYDNASRTRERFAKLRTAA